MLILMVKSMPAFSAPLLSKPGHNNSLMKETKIKNIIV